MRTIFVAVLMVLIGANASWAYEPKTFGSWRVTCGTDSLNDHRTCSMDWHTEVAAVTKEARVLFTVYRGIKSDNVTLMVFSSSFAYGEPVYIRVDKNPAVESHNTVKSKDAIIFPEAVVNQLLVGQQAFVRFTDLYSHIEYDADIDLKGFAEALAYLKSIKE